MVAVLIGFLLAEATWHRWLFEEGGIVCLLFAFLIFDAILSPFRVRDDLARARLIRKLYHALEVKGEQVQSRN
jgi:hypothetical protein